MARYWLIVFAAVLLPTVPALATDAIVNEGKTKWVIVSPQNASATEAFAAHELRRYLREMSGIELETVNEIPPSFDWLIVANNDKVAPPALPDNFQKSREEDGFSITGAANAIVLS